MKNMSRKRKIYKIIFYSIIYNNQIFKSIIFCMNKIIFHSFNDYAYKYYEKFQNYEI